MILHGPIKQMWTQLFQLGNVISPWIVNDTTNETERFFKKYYRKRKILNPKNQVLRKSTPAFSHDSINANHIKNPLTGTDQFWAF